MYCVSIVYASVFSYGYLNSVELHSIISFVPSVIIK